MEKITQSKKFISIICLVLAILLWCFVSYQENPSMSKTVKNVPIVIIGEQALNESGFSVYSVSEQSVDVKATAKRLSLARITNKTLSAAVNVSSIKKSGKHVLPAAITSSLSSSASYYVKGKDITIVIEPIVTQTHSIEVNIENPQDTSLVLNSYTLSSEKVKVTAPQSIIKEIESIRTEKIVPVKDNNSSTVRLQVFAKNGKILEGVKCDPSEVSVEYLLDSTKTLPVVLKTTDGKTHLLPSDYDIEVCGNGTVFENLKQIETQAVNLSGYKAGDKIETELNLPENIRLNKGSSKVEVALLESYFEKQ